jgi:chitinase
MKARAWWAAAGMAAIVSSAVPSSAEEIIYLPSWQGNVSQIQWGIVDYVMYAFAIPNADGSVGAIENGAKLTQACQAAHQNGKRCLLSFGGWNNGNDSGFEALAASSSGRSNFAQTCLNLVNQYGLDGVDFDWEYPEAEDAMNYGLMVDAVRARIGSSKLITAAAANHGYNARAVQQNLTKLNFAMIMSYDGDGGAGHSPYSYAVTAMDDWAPYGLGKTFLGVPFYARPSWAGYSTLLAAGCSPSSDTCTYQGTLNYYNGQPTIRAKRDLCLNRGCRGLMAWEVTFDVSDSRSLQQAMNGGGSGPTPTPRPRPRVTPTPTATPTPGSGPTPTPTPTPASGYVEVTPGGSAVTASANDGNLPPNTVDNNLSTRWSANGDGQWIRYDLGTSRTIGYVRIAFYNGNSRQSRFDLQTSADNVSWSNAITGALSSGTSTNEQTFDFSDRSARYVRYLGHGNTVNAWNSLTEVSIFATSGGTPVPTPTPSPTPTPGGSNPTPTPVPGGTWQPGVFYAVGANVTYGGLGYRCIQAHTSQVSWEPPNAPALWARQ